MSRPVVFHVLEISPPEASLASGGSLRRGYLKSKVAGGAA